MIMMGAHPWSLDGTDTNPGVHIYAGDGSSSSVATRGVDFDISTFLRNKKMQIARIEFCKKNRIAVKFCRLRQFKKLKKTQFAIANCASQSTEIEKKRNRAIRNCELRQPVDRFRKKMKERNPQLQIAPASRPSSKKNEITQFAIADCASQVTRLRSGLK